MFGFLTDTKNANNFMVISEHFALKIIPKILMETLEGSLDMVKTARKGQAVINNFTASTFLM